VRAPLKNEAWFGQPVAKVFDAKVESNMEQLNHALGSISDEGLAWAVTVENSKAMLLDLDTDNTETTVKVPMCTGC
jgi:hypothetical protein